MNKTLLILTLLLSMPSFAATVVYSCKIDMSQLGPGYTDDLKFEITVGESQGSISMFGEPVSDDCEQSPHVVKCTDAEGMPYIARIKNDNIVSLEVGYILPETNAICEKLRR